MLVLVIRGSLQEATEAISIASTLCEAIEFRLDLMESIDLVAIEKLKARTTLSTIFTLRKQSHGGGFTGTELEREKKLLELLTLKPTYVDLEYDSKFFHKIDPHIQVISSYHNFDKTPKTLDLVLKKMKEKPAQIYKIVTMAHSSLDACKMLIFVKKEKHVAGMCMGSLGEITRILAPIVESPLTYTSIEEKSVVNQVPLSELIDRYHYFSLNRSTQIYALIGDPIDQSIGHIFYNQIFKRCNYNGVYVKILVKLSELSRFFSLVRKLPFGGFSITMPLKEVVIPYVQKIDLKAKESGAINTLINNKGSWFGTNTDGIGALNALEKKGQVAGKTLLVIGAGGAAKAIATQAWHRGARLIIANRTIEKGNILATQVQGKAIFFSEVEKYSYDIVVHATPVGMSPTTEEMILLEKSIQKKIIGLDLIICPKKNKALAFH